MEKVSYLDSLSRELALQRGYSLDVESALAATRQLRHNLRKISFKSYDHALDTLEMELERHVEDIKKIWEEMTWERLNQTKNNV